MNLIILDLMTDQKSRPLLLCDITQCMLAVVYRRFGTAYLSRTKGSSCPETSVRCISSQNSEGLV